MKLHRKVVAVIAAATFSLQGVANDDLRQLQLDLIEQVDLLQQEVQSLRGLVEAQSRELEQLKDDGRSRYLDLDGRLSQLQSQVQVGGISGAAASPGNAADTSVTSPGDPAQEAESYQAAFELIRERQFEQALVALRAFRQAYPDGERVADALYWQAKVHDVLGQPDAAIESFERLLEAYPEYRRRNQAQLELGRIFLEIGNPQGQVLLGELIERAPGSPEAQEAEAVLSEGA